MLQDYGQSVETMHAYIVAQYQDLVRAFSAGHAVIHTELTLLCMQVAGIQGRAVRRSADHAQHGGDAARIAA
jgi:hypothetical protein